MFFRFRSLVPAVLLIGLWTIAAHARDITVCADPDNMPFSNREQQGFENRIAELVARDLHAQLHYVWQRMGRGFVREYIDQSACDLLIGIPAGFSAMSTTRPYYRSTYVFVVRRKGSVRPQSLDDNSLRRAKIGVQVLEEDYTPPAQSLARRGMQSSIVAFHTMGKDADSIVRAVADRRVDTAIVWGPLAGYFAAHYQALELIPVMPEMDAPGIPLTFAISMGVRKGNTSLQSELEAVLSRSANEIRKILNDYHVPQLQMAQAASSTD